MESLSQRLGFMTMGMFIIDEIEHLNGKAPGQRIIGGAGTYAALGARLAAGGSNSKYVSWIVDMGSDFPPAFKVLIESWRTSCTFRLDMNRLTTTAWNGYGPNEFRAFKYLTPKRRLEEHSLSDEQALARSFHMVCSPTRCMFLVNTIMARRHTLAGDDEPRPIFVWEPIPDLCTPEEYARLRETAKLVDVVSPNADEFASFFTSHPKCTTRESMVEHFLGLDQEPESTPLEAALVIREGAQGCTTYLGGAKTKLHLHAFHQSAERVIDPTGGGNTFLGALAMATTGAAFPTEKDILTESNIPESKFSRQKLLFGLLHATVAASYSIEQMGVSIPSETDPDCWNGESYRDRLLAFLAREKEHIISQITKESSDS